MDVVNILNNVDQAYEDIVGRVEQDIELANNAVENTGNDVDIDEEEEEEGGAPEDVFDDDDLLMEDNFPQLADPANPEPGIQHHGNEFGGPDNPPGPVQPPQNDRPPFHLNDSRGYMNLAQNMGSTSNDWIIYFTALMMRFKAPYEMLLSIFSWCNDQFPENWFPLCKRDFWKCLSKNDKGMDYMVFCQNCGKKVGDNGRVTRRCLCGDCTPEASNPPLAWFVPMNIRSQIEEFLKKKGAYQSLRYRYTRGQRQGRERNQGQRVYSDIYDGRKYRLLSRPGKFLNNPWNYSFTLWADGVKISKSSKATSWSIFLIINELSPRARCRNIILAGIWIGDKHPVMNSIFLPVVQRLRDLYANGVVWKPFHNENR